MTPVDIDKCRWKDGRYRCPYHCGDPRYPRRKWKTEAGFRKHLAECPERPEVVAERKVEQDRVEQERQERSAARIAACPRKVGDTIIFVYEIVVEPEYRDNGYRRVRVRYEAKCRYEARRGVIRQICHDGRNDSSLAWFDVGYGTGITEDQIMPTWESAEEAAKDKQRRHEAWLEQCALCR